MVIFLNYTLRKTKGNYDNKWQLTPRQLWGHQNADTTSKESNFFLAPSDCWYTEMPIQILKHLTLPILKTMHIEGPTVQ